MNLDATTINKFGPPPILLWIRLRKTRLSIIQISNESAKIIVVHV